MRLLLVTALALAGASAAAAQWKKSVARGDVDAMNNLGSLLYYGYGVTKDLDAAIDSGGPLQLRHPQGRQRFHATAQGETQRFGARSRLSTRG